jgi:hypothetical protein
MTMNIKFNQNLSKIIKKILLKKNLMYVNNKYHKKEKKKRKILTVIFFVHLFSFAVLCIDIFIFLFHNKYYISLQNCIHFVLNILFN